MKKNDIRKIFVAGLILSPYLYFGNLSNAQTYYNPYGVTYTGNSSSGMMNPYYSYTGNSSSGMMNPYYSYIGNSSSGMMNPYYSYIGNSLSEVMNPYYGSYYPTIDEEESSSALAEKLESLLSKYCIPKLSNDCSTAALSFTNDKCYCGGGKYYKPSSRSCGTCTKGTYSDGYEYDSCPYCPKGQYQNLTGQTSCKYCPVGQYQDVVGQTSCKSCPAGKYSSSGASSCTSCPTGQYSSAGSSSCNSCTNAPANAHYTSHATSNSCSWACDSGYKKSGSTCVKDVRYYEYEYHYYGGSSEDGGHAGQTVYERTGRYKECGFTFERTGSSNQIGVRCDYVNGNNIYRSGISDNNLLNTSKGGSGKVIKADYVSAGPSGATFKLTCILPCE